MKSRAVNEAGRIQLQEGLRNLGFPCVGDKGNFVLFSLENAANVFQALQEMGIIVRPLAGYGLPDYLRVTIGTESENARFLKALMKLTN
jgi:histidinol-phosphate aminotransferase